MKRSPTVGCSPGVERRHGCECGSGDRNLSHKRSEGPQEIASLPPRGDRPDSSVGWAPTGDKTTGVLQDADRVLPGEGGLPLADYVKAVLGTTGYSGPLSVEAFHPKYELGEPAMVAQEAFRQAEALLATSTVEGHRSSLLST